MDQYIERVVDLLDPSLNRIYNMAVDEARRRVLSGKPEAVREIDGSFALLARDGKTVRMARSLDRPMRYFLAKRHEGPALIVADRIAQRLAWQCESPPDLITWTSSDDGHAPAAGRARGSESIVSPADR